MPPNQLKFLKWLEIPIETTQTLKLHAIIMPVLFFAGANAGCCFSDTHEAIHIIHLLAKFISVHVLHCVVGSI